MQTADAFVWSTLTVFKYYTDQYAY